MVSSVVSQLFNKSGRRERNRMSDMLTFDSISNKSVKGITFSALIRYQIDYLGASMKKTSNRFIGFLKHRNSRMSRASSVRLDYRIEIANRNRRMAN